jgi:hypothetical protein
MIIYRKTKETIERRVSMRPIKEWNWKRIVAVVSSIVTFIGGLITGKELPL